MQLIASDTCDTAVHELKTTSSDPDRMILDTSMKRIQFSATYPAQFVHPLHRNIMDGTPITRAELLMWSPTAEPMALLWFDGGRDATETVIEDIESILVSNLVEEADGTYAFLLQDEYELAELLMETIRDSRVIFLPPVIFLETGAVQFEAVGEPSQISTLHEKLTHLGELRIERVHDFDRRGSPAELTERQREALETAMTVGYYEVPRSGTVGDVAAHLDCSQSTAGELIRKAEAGVIRSFLST